MPLRLALYERAFLNLGSNNGPLLMGVFSASTRLLVFKMITPGVPQTTEEFIAPLGFVIGGQLPFTGPFQRLVWEDDRLEVIERELRDMVTRIEGRARDGVRGAPDGRETPPEDSPRRPWTHATVGPDEFAVRRRADRFR